MSELNEKQQLFVQEYLIDLNATAAYKRAGYLANNASAGVNAHKLLKHPHVAKAIQVAMDKRAEQIGVDSEYVLKTIVETIQRCRQSSPVVDRNGKQVYVETPDGKIVPAYTFEANAVLKGAELLGKHLKLFTDKVEQTGKDGGPIEVANLAPEMSKDEWLQAHGIGQHKLND
jgi:phage terminase small subunit